WTGPGGADGEDRVVVIFCQLRETLLPVGICVVPPSSDLLDLGVELAGRPLHTLPRQLVDARVSAPANVVGDGDARYEARDAGERRRGRCLPRRGLGGLRAFRRGDGGEREQRTGDEREREPALPGGHG